jgi:hypothetical protein
MQIKMCENQGPQGLGALSHNWKIHFYAPAMKWTGAYIVLPFVILSFHKLVSVHYLLNDCTHLIQIWYMDTA